MEGGTGGRRGGMVRRYRNGRICGNVVTLAVDNEKWIGGPWLKYRVEVACVFEVAENITGRKQQQQYLVTELYDDGKQDFLNGKGNIDTT